MKTEQKQKLDNYIVIPRYILDKRIKGEITKGELDVYVWTRLSCNAYGIAKVSLENIANDVLSGCSKNYANKILLGLRNKRLIYYKDRQGRRGSFEVHHGDFIMLNGQLKTLDDLFETAKVTSRDTSQSILQSEVKTEVSSFIPKFDVEKANISHSGFQKIKTSFRSNDNDKENDKDKEYIDNKDFPLKGIPVRGFDPKNNDESRCLEIAQNLGETDMRFILAALYRCGVAKVENAWGFTKEAENVDDPRRYFNSLISNLPCFRSKTEDL